MFETSNKTWTLMREKSLNSLAELFSSEIILNIYGDETIIILKMNVYSMVKMKRMGEIQVHSS